MNDDAIEVFKEVKQKYVLASAVMTWIRNLKVTEKKYLTDSQIKLLDDTNGCEATEYLRQISGDNLKHYFDFLQYEDADEKNSSSDKKKLKCEGMSMTALEDTLNTLKRQRRNHETKVQGIRKSKVEIVQSNSRATSWFKKISRWQKIYIEKSLDNQSFLDLLRPNTRLGHASDAVMAYCNFLKWWLFTMMNDFNSDMNQRMYYLDAACMFIQETVPFLETFHNDHKSTALMRGYNGKPLYVKVLFWCKELNQERTRLMYTVKNPSFGKLFENIYRNLKNVLWLGAYPHRAGIAGLIVNLMDHNKDEKAKGCEKKEDKPMECNDWREFKEYLDDTKERRAINKVL